jgi:hypothetical protein
MCRSVLNGLSPQISGIHCFLREGSRGNVTFHLAACIWWSVFSQKDESAYINYRNISQCLELEVARKYFVLGGKFSISTVPDFGHFRL